MSSQDPWPGTETHADALLQQQHADSRLREQREEVQAETAAMSDAYAVLQPLGEEARHRAVRWLAQALDLRRAYDRDVPF